MKKAVFLSVLIRVSIGLCSLVLILTVSLPVAFASGGKQPGHQPGTFIHLASTVRPAGVALGPGATGRILILTNALANLGIPGGWLAATR